jgi:acetyl-CoA acetyltransferase family protein
MSDVFIVEAVRTPVGRGKENGALHNIHPVDLLGTVLSEVCARAGIEKGRIDDIIAGCVSPIGEQGANVPRLALLKAGFPVEVPGVQLNRMCGSSQQAVHFASQAIASGDMDLVIASGIEMMSRVPMGSDWGGLTEEFLADFPFPLRPMGICAEDIAEEWDLSREELDAYSAESHQRAALATEAGAFKSQIMPMTVSVDGNTKIVDYDEGFRKNIEPEKMASLKTIFKEGGRITAGNASQISDGAAALLLASERAVAEYGLKERARIVARVVVGSDPRLTLTGPIPATQRILEKTGLSIHDMDVIEINEAFACVVLAWAKELRPDMTKVNANGGAIATGHPLGATGAILMTKMVHELERSGGRYGLQTMCIGHGMATATIIERIAS